MKFLEEMSNNVFESPDIKTPQTWYKQNNRMNIVRSRIYK